MVRRTESRYSPTACRGGETRSRWGVAVTIVFVAGAAGAGAIVVVVAVLVGSGVDSDGGSGVPNMCDRNAERSTKVHPSLPFRFVDRCTTAHRLTGVDVWQLLEETTATTPANSNHNDRLPSQEISRKALLRFLGKLGIDVIVPPPSPSTTTYHYKHGENLAYAPDSEAATHNTSPEQQQKQQQQRLRSSSPSSVRETHHANQPPTPPVDASDGRDRSRALERYLTGARSRDEWLSGSTEAGAAAGGDGVRLEIPGAAAVGRGEREGGGSSAPPSCDRYIRQLSEDTASVRCRLEVSCYFFR